MLLSGCASGNRDGLRYQAAKEEQSIPGKVPQRYVDCRALAKLPPLKPGQKGYTRAQATAALANVRASEIEKADCLHDLTDWTEGQLGVIKGE